MPLKAEYFYLSEIKLCSIDISLNDWEMEDTYTLIIHGWSDCSASFVEMKKRFEERGIGNVESILYADYQSREDNITFNDVIDGLNRQLIDLGLIQPDGTSEE